MSKKPKIDRRETAPWTAEDLAKSRPASELPDDVLAAFPNTKAHVARMGRPPKEQIKTPVKLRLDGDVLEALRASGPGWQTRINDQLKAQIVEGVVVFRQPRNPARSHEAKTPGKGNGIKLGKTPKVKAKATAAAKRQRA
jgi:uncharacterized protein (DUF4415 family)